MRETIAVKVSRFKLIAVAVDAQQADAVAFELTKPAFRTDQGADTIFTARDGAERSLRPAVPISPTGTSRRLTRDLAGEVFRPHVAFLYPEIEIIALGGRRIGGEFLRPRSLPA